MKCIKFLLELIWDGTKEEKKRKETWLLFRLFRAANLTSGRSMCPCVAYRSPGILCAYSMRKRIWNLMVKQSRSDSCNLPPKPFQTCLTRDCWSRAELWHCFHKGGWGKGGASSWWMAVQTSLSQPPKNCVPNPVTVRPQGIIAACYLQEKCLAFSRGRLDWIAAA